MLVRLFTEPIGTLLVDVPDQGLRPADLAAAIDAELGDLLAPRLAELGADRAADRRHHPGAPSRPSWPAAARCCAPPRRSPWWSAPGSGPARWPAAWTACSPRRTRPSGSWSSTTRRSATRPPRWSGRPPAAARSTTWPSRRPACPSPATPRSRAAPGEILAWIDDDEYADVNWLAEVARALADHPDADVVSGVIVPAELETQAQIWFEQFGGHSKGRGFRPDVFSPATAHIQSPLYPLPPFGTGANMTFRPGVHRADRRLGHRAGRRHPGDGLRGHPGLHPGAGRRRHHRLPADRGHPPLPPARPERPAQADGRVRRRADRRLHQPAAAAGRGCCGR